MRQGKWWLWLLVLTIWGVRAQPTDIFLEAANLQQQGHYRAALAVLNRAWKDKQKYSPQQQSDIQLQQGIINIALADNAKALDSLIPNLRERLKQFGATSSETALAYDALGLSFLKLADANRSFEFLKKNLRVSLLEGPQSEAAALAYDHLGRAYAFIGEQEKAREFFAKALRVWLTSFGPTSSQAAIAYNDLGLLALQNGKLQNAVHFLEKAKRVRETELGHNHIETAATLNSLGLAYTNQQRFVEASANLEQAKQARETELGQNNPDTGGSYNNLGVLALKQNQVLDALKWLGKAFEVFQETTAQNYAILDTSGKLRYNSANRFRLRTMLRAATGGATLDENTRQKMAGYWLSFKGSAFALENGLAPLYGQASGITKGIDEYQKLRQELAKLYTRTPSNIEEAKQISERTNLVQQRLVELEREMSGRLNGVGNFLALRRVSANDLADTLDDDEMYLDYAWFEDDVFALTTRPGGETTISRLAKPKDLEPKIIALRNAAQQGDSSAASKTITNELFTTLIAPLTEQMIGMKQIVLSADGALQFLPFELLTDPSNNNLLLQRFNMRFTPTARELLRLRQNTASQFGKIELAPAAVFGNPDFQSQTIEQTQSSQNLATPDQLRGSGAVYLTQLLRRMNFKPLPFSETEAKAVANVLGSDTQLFLGEAANETNLFNLHSPRILHLATHGFFLNDSKLPNALLRVGLALSGARISAVSGEAYGLLTGLRLGGLNLDGTELVTLSACETALGDNLAGEGVAGLNQAFLMAGARRVMLSLWKVPDRETSDLMKDFYTRWKAGAEPSEALRQAKLAMMKQGLPPRDWAAFMISGE